MGTSRNVQQFVEKIEKVPAEFAKANRTGNKASALLVQKSTLGLMAKASGGDLVLNHVGKGAPIGVTIKSEGDGLLVKATGPVQLVENRIREHLVVPKHTGVARGSGFRRSRKGRSEAVDNGSGIYGPRDVLNLGGGRYVRWVSVPAHNGKHPWRKGVDAVKGLTPAEYQKAYHAALLGVFR